LQVVIDYLEVVSGINSDCCMVHGSWCMVHGAWCMVPGGWCMVHGGWWLVPGLPAWEILALQVTCARSGGFRVPRTCCLPYAMFFKPNGFSSVEPRRVFIGQMILFI